MSPRGRPGNKNSKSGRASEGSDEGTRSNDESSTSPSPDIAPDRSHSGPHQARASSADAQDAEASQTDASDESDKKKAEPSERLHEGEGRMNAASGSLDGHTPPPRNDGSSDNPFVGGDGSSKESETVREVGQSVIELAVVRDEPRAEARHPIYSRMRSLRYVRFKHSVVFFLYAVLGVAALITVKSFSTQLNVLLYFVAVGAIMSTYFALNMADISGLKLRYDQLGDNLYYLGFIYTLGTLTHTLYIYDARSENISEVISSFGIALSSTAMGVILRIVAHLMRIDPHEVEDVVRIELIDLTSRVRASLDTVVRDLSVFGEQTRLVMEEMRDETSKTVTEGARTLADASNRILPLIDETFRAFTDNTTRTNALNAEMIAALTALVARIDAVEAPTDMIAQKLRPAVGQVERGVEQTISALSTLIGRIHAIETPPDLIAQKLGPAMGQIERVIAVMARVTQEEESRIERLKSVTDAMNAAIGSVRNHLDLIAGATNQQEVAQRIRVAANALKDMSENVVGLRDQMKRLVESETSAVSSLRSEYERTVATIRDQGIATKQELDRFRSLTSEMQDSLVELARALRKAV